MKNKLLLFSPFLALILLIVYGFGGGQGSKYPGGSPPGYTGSPGDGKDCTQCHGGTASTSLNIISSDIPDDGYWPGNTYNITVTLSGSGDKGFLVAPQNIDGDLLGTLTAGSESKLVGSDSYITQTTGSSANPKVWEFSWTAPDAGTGNVTFYGAFTINKPVTKLSTYTIPENTGVSVSEILDFSSRVYPNPVSDFVMIGYNSDRDEDIEISLINQAGQKIILQNSITITQGRNSLGLNMPEDLNPGLYILMMKGERLHDYKKILIQ